MIDYYPALEPGKYYHIFNHAAGKLNLFASDKNYHYFLEKYALHLNERVNTYAYCLLPNHFHFLIQIKETPNDVDKQLYIKSTSKKFSNLFSAYSQAFNKQQNSFGNLFMKRFKRKQITDEEYFKEVVFYIHRNPVHHGLVKQPDDWKYSSWHSLISTKPTRILRDEVIQRFDTIENFTTWHQQQSNEKSALEMEFL